MPFFDSVGSQLKDMITHLCAMIYPLLIELKPGLEIAQLRESKEKIAKSWRVVGQSIWGQYEGDPTPTTSTFTAFILECEIQEKKLRIKFITGKALPEKYCEIEVIFDKKFRLVLRHSPNEGMTFYFPVKKPGSGVELVPAKMEFSYQSAFGTVNQPAYLRLLFDILDGDNSSFASPIEALQALRIADELEASFKGSLVKYPVGTYPEEAKDWLPSEWS
jgi:glucose-6-phosphate 1-dehydrogenase